MGIIGPKKAFFSFAFYCSCFLFIRANGFVVVPAQDQWHRLQDRVRANSREVFGLASRDEDADDEKGRYSYVEGERYDDRLAEIEALGGDPFFFDDDDQNTEPDTSDAREEADPSSFMSGMGSLSGLMGVIGEGTEERYPTDGKGPTPKGVKDIPVDEWDGTVDEEAHFDFD